MNITNITYNITNSNKSDNNINIIVILIIILFFGSFLIFYVHFMVCRTFPRLPNISPQYNNYNDSDSDSDYEDRYYTGLSNSQFSINNTLRVGMTTSIESESIETKEILTFSNINKYSIFCSICQENQLNTIKIDCNHHFCEECIKEYLKINNNNCPICRNNIDNIYKIKVKKIF
tara:strand:- start:367 stop:891 length:525 start_codon:yes stop_codon:yes gene_type:complete